MIVLLGVAACALLIPRRAARLCIAWCLEVDSVPVGRPGKPAFRRRAASSSLSSSKCIFMRFRAWVAVLEVASTLALAAMRAPVSFRFAKKRQALSVMLRWTLCASAKHLATCDCNRYTSARLSPASRYVAFVEAWTSNCIAMRDQYLVHV